MPNEGGELRFVSSGFLGLDHSHGELEPWRRLTTGVPGALSGDSSSRELSRRLASHLGYPDGVFARSTLHLARDLFGLWPSGRVLLDSGTYPILRWGAGRMALGGGSVRMFEHHQLEALRRELRSNDGSHAIPLVVCDGWCPRCGRMAPLAEYAELARSQGGIVIVDDTQALGILGRRSPGSVLGSGGGGSLARLGLGGSPDFVVIASLAKGLAAPIALLTSTEARIERYRRVAETFVHCSAPSAADLAAARRAASFMDEERGDGLRRSLALRVKRFREGLRALRLEARGWFFPIQTLAEQEGFHPVRAFRRLEKLGIRAVLLRADGAHPVQMGLSISVKHSASALGSLLDAIRRSLDRGVAA